MPSSSSVVSVSIENHIAHVQLNRPEKHNAINMDMFFAIDSTIKQLAKDKTVRAVIVSGNGDNFCSGIDIKSVLTNPKHAIKLLWKWLPGNANLAQRVSVGWRMLDVPVIMAISGHCWGCGMQIALGGDFRIATPNASLAVMEAHWGLIPDMGGTLALQECMSEDQAMKLAMTAEPISGQDALALGLITDISETPLAAAQQLAEKLVNRSPDTNRTIKKMYHSIWQPKTRRILSKETLNQLKVIMGKNQKIAVKRAQGKTDIEFK